MPVLMPVGSRAGYLNRWGTLSEVLEHLRDYQPRYRPQAVGCLPLQRLAPSPGKFQQVSSPPL